MEPSTHSPPQDLDTHIQGLFSSLDAAKELLNIKTGAVPKPMKSTNIYYPQATPRSPNLSHLPLPPSLLLPTTLRLVSNNAAVNPTYRGPMKHRAMAFELSTPTALLQSLHFYFPIHISANLAAGLYPSFSEISLLVGPPASGIPDHDRDQGEFFQIPIQKVFSPSGSGAEMYVERIIKEASGERLRGVIVYIDWKSRAQEVAEQMDEEMEMARRPRRRTARRRAPYPPRGGMFEGSAGSIFGPGDLGPTYTSDSPAFGDAYANGDRRYTRLLLGAGEHDDGHDDGNRREQMSIMELAQEAMELAQEVREQRQTPEPTFRQFLETSAPPGLMETMGGGWSDFLDAIERGVSTAYLAGGGRY